MEIQEIQNYNFTFGMSQKLASKVVKEAKPIVNDIEKDTFSYGVKVVKFNKNLNGNNKVKLEIDGDPYEFITDITDEKKLMKNLSYKNKSYPKYKGSLAQMVDNIRDTLKGVFVRNGKYEDFVADLHPQYPNIIKDKSLLLYGNKKTVNNEETKKACEILSNISNNNVKLKDLKTIEYKVKLGKYANNERKTAYAYYDDCYEIQYYYIPDRNEIKTRNVNDYVTTIKLAK